MEITGQYSWNEESSKPPNHFLLPHNMRALLIGHSNCGKSTLMFTLLLKPDILSYENLLVFGNSLFQTEYTIIKAGFEKKLSKKQLEILFENKDEVNKHGGPVNVIDRFDGPCLGNITATFYKSCEDIPDPQTLNSSLNNLVLFDDCYLGSQSKISAYYSRGRHTSCSVFYISQSYFKIPRQCIRMNANFIILFRQSSRDMRQIFIDHVSHDNIDFDIFLNEFCIKTWDLAKYSFICLDLTRTKATGKYRQNLDTFWFPPVK